MSMKSSHTDALAGEAIGGAPGGARSASAPRLVGSVMRRGSGKVGEKLRAKRPRRNAPTRTIRFVAVTRTDAPLQPTHPPSRRLIWLITVATAASVANLYYNQPLLSSIARTFQASSRSAGAIATLTQAGYAVGLLLFVPLGDVVELRRLITVLLCLVAVALLVTGLGPSLAVVMVASFAVGVTTVVPQLLLPLAAGLSPPAMRGRIVGQVVSGLLVGILAGRAVAGVVGDVAGWRAMYLVASAAMLALAVLLWNMLPAARPTASASYRS